MRPRPLPLLFGPNILRTNSDTYTSLSLRFGYRDYFLLWSFPPDFVIRFPQTVSWRLFVLSLFISRISLKASAYVRLSLLKYRWVTGMRPVPLSTKFSVKYVLFLSSCISNKIKYGLSLTPSDIWLCLIWIRDTVVTSSHYHMYVSLSPFVIELKKLQPEVKSITVT